MRSSTSSSDARTPPDGPWGRTFALAAVLFLAAAASVEAFWRSRGHTPSVADDVALWCVERDRVTDGGGRAVVLLGASRIQLGFSADAFHAALPDRPLVMLAIDGRNPAAALADVAAEPRFRGVAIVSLIESLMLPERLGDQQDHVDAYHARWTRDMEANRRVRTWLQERLLVVNPGLGLLEAARRTRAAGALPQPAWVTTSADRSRAGDFERPSFRPGDVAPQTRAYFAGLRTGTHQEFMQTAHELERHVERIQARGGRVVFVRLPATGERWEIEQRRNPRARDWDRLAATTSAATVHFRDVPGMAGVTCPDGSHVDVRDRDAVTRALLTELARRGVF